MLDLVVRFYIYTYIYKSKQLAARTAASSKKLCIFLISLGGLLFTGFKERSFKDWPVLSKCVISK